MIHWHRLFGLALIDYFTGTPYSVEMEKDLARKRQLLDILVIHSREGKPLSDPCDGLEDLRRHNLMTYKSGQEALDGWAIEELMGHYVNYRKALAPHEPLESFGLYAVATRRPASLMATVNLTPIKVGVYQLPVVTHRITVIVLSEVARVPRNALWELFSFHAEAIARGARDYHWRQKDHVTLLRQLYHRYHEAGLVMSYTFDDFHRDLALELLKKLSPEERLKGLPPEERLKGLPPEERLKGLPPEELLKRLPPKERLKGLSGEELMAALDPDQWEQLQHFLAQKRVQ